VLNKNRSLSIILGSVVIGLIIFGVYSVVVLEPNERAGELGEAKQVAKNLNMIAAEDIDCDDIKGKVQTIEAESFEGKNLIRDALMNTMVKGGCFEFDSNSTGFMIANQIFNTHDNFMKCMDDERCYKSLVENSTGIKLLNEMDEKQKLFEECMKDYECMKRLEDKP